MVNKQLQTLIPCTVNMIQSADLIGSDVTFKFGEYRLQQVYFY